MTLTITVSTNADSGPGSLRQAILDANAASGNVLISFSITGIIPASSPFPDITNDYISIDGSTSPEYIDIPLVAIDFNRHVGFNIKSNYVTINALSLYKSIKYTIKIKGTYNNIYNCYIGIDSNKVAQSNNGHGIYLAQDSSNNRVGGNQDAISGYTSNVIANCSKEGIFMHKSSYNTIANNYIGLDPGGLFAMPNRNGISMCKSDNNTIGGDVFINSEHQKNDPTGSKNTQDKIFVKPLLGNTISRNLEHGIKCINCNFNTIMGNFVGTNPDGNLPMGNGFNGCYINKCKYISLLGCHVYNQPFVFYNVFCDNGYNGLDINDSDHITIQGNFFGISANNSISIGNKKNGILIRGSSNNIVNGGIIPMGSGCSGNYLSGVSIEEKASNVLNYNIFAGIFAFGEACPNSENGFSITSSGIGIGIRTCVTSGNSQYGVYLAGDSNNVSISETIAGANTNVTSTIPNGFSGICIGGNSNNNFLGEAIQSVISVLTVSGNGQYGIVLKDNSYNNTIINTYIGTDLQGVASFSNLLGGILITNNSHNNIIGQLDNINLISGNQNYGIRLDSNTYLNLIQNNWIGITKLLTPLPNSLGSILNNSIPFKNTIFNNNTV